MITSAALWAQGFDIIVALIIIFGFLVPLVMQVIEKLKEAQQKGGGGQRPQQRRQPPARAQGPADADVEDEIGDFLRRAAERRQGGQPAQAMPAQPRRPQPPRRPPARQPVEAILVEERAPRSAFPDLTQQVERDIDTRKFAQRSKQLERRAEQARRKAEQHAHQVFDHPVGHLTDSPAAPGETGVPAAALGAEVGPGLAAGLPALLASPLGLRQAIVLAEILQRPEHRWG
jgi:flagellar biosynthesis/type III secretory pathway M-ring protein FliF/YscJ